MGFNSGFKGLKSGSLKLLEPSGPVQALGLLYLYLPLGKTKRGCDGNIKMDFKWDVKGVD